MHKITIGAFLLGIVLTLSASPSLSEEPEATRAGLPPGEGQEDVYYTCSACHSIKTVTQQRLSRDRWSELLDWMVEEQGMTELEAEERQRILDYLSTHLSPETPR